MILAAQALNCSSTEPGFEALRSGQVDLLGDGPNLYAYVENDPVDRIDQFGLDGEATLAAEPTLLMDEEALAAPRRTRRMVLKLTVKPRSLKERGGKIFGQTCCKNPSMLHVF